MVRPSPKQAWRRWRLGTTWFHEPKRRRISAAPFADRVVHHALMRLTQPRFEADFIAHSYANRLGLGMHRAIQRMAHCVRRYRHVLRLDVRQHFAHIDHAILQDILFRRVPEAGLRRVIGLILASGAEVHLADSDAELFPGDDLLALTRLRGLPIGNLTSQCWSNCYLDPLDQFVSRTLRCGAYLRYVDDFALFDDDPVALQQANERVRAFLAQRLRLRVHESSAQVHHSCHGVSWLGFVVSTRAIRLKSRKVVEASRRLHWLYRSWQENCITFGELQASVQGWLAHARLGSGHGVIRVVLDRMMGSPHAVGADRHHR